VEDFENIAETIYNLSSFDDIDNITITFVTKAMQLAGPCKHDSPTACEGCKSQLMVAEVDRSLTYKYKCMGSQFIIKKFDNIGQLIFDKSFLQ
jgi:hypothetical protein